MPVAAWVTPDLADRFESVSLWGFVRTLLPAPARVEMLA